MSLLQNRKIVLMEVDAEVNMSDWIWRCGCDFECEKFICNLGIDIKRIQINITME